MIYRIDPKTWTVEHMFPTVGYRPHGVGIETPDARYLWESDTNMGAFFKRDMVTGEVVDSIQLPEGSPFPHGMSVWKGYIYWTDDIGGGLAPICSRIRHPRTRHGVDRSPPVRMREVALRSNPAAPAAPKRFSRGHLSAELGLGLSRLSGSRLDEGAADTRCEQLPASLRIGTLTVGFRSTPLTRL